MFVETPCMCGVSLVPVYDGMNTKKIINFFFKTKIIDLFFAFKINIFQEFSLSIILYPKIDFYNGENF